VVALCLLLIAVGFGVALPACWLAMRWARRAGALDTAPMPGQVKEARRAVPNVGGVGIFWGITLPVIAGLALAWFGPENAAGWPAWAQGALDHREGVRAQTPLAVLVIVSMGLLHVLGLIDDRRPLGPRVKLAVMTLPALAASLSGVVFPEWRDTRLLTLADPVVGGAWLSVLVTVVWFLAVTNAMNFLDNMDGLTGGVALIAGACFLAAALVGGQWFVAGLLALLVGACAGFLVFNLPPARLFMGDGGSLVLGYLLAFLTVRTTYVGTEAGGPSSGAWYAVLMPLVVLAVPLYDLVAVSIVRLSQGKSPMVGDLQHLSHRLARRGLGKRGAVATIWAFTLATGLAGIVLGRVGPWQAAVLGGQIAVLIAALAVLEFGPAWRTRWKGDGALGRLEAQGGAGHDA
jgi:UDP-GlcNAc:undecaprenyl-phosphate GlcNAc-1-phosphate transferase